MRASLSASTPLVAAIVWTVALMVDSSPYDTAAATLIAAGLLTTSSVATVGMIVTGGRWARLLALGAVLATTVVAVLRPVDVLWMLGIGATAISLFALFSPGLTRTIRRLPSASGPPPRAIAGPLLALYAPVLLGLAGSEADEWALLVVGLSAPVAAFMYTRVLPGGLMAVRIIWPAAALALAPLLGPLCGSVTAALAVGVAVASWHPLAKASYHPPQEKGTALPIPPELAPSDVLDAAEIDDRGRRR
ncbi:MAG: hypothetical protein PVG83_13925 [Acidimicrobiia bacterium]